MPRGRSTTPDLRKAEGRWTVVEANAAWGSGCDDSDPGRALDTALRAAGAAGEPAPHEPAFIRRKP
ncbi:hypothetical protein [Streptomyces sp. CB00316]|uniref:hypothetical protein n=1 Tax=Streptomyces sp. CB00316 TaxID=1703932 RepID=UPI0018FE6987